jgi:hypothetical protein
VIFKPEMVEKILAGEKTVTRRPVKLEDGGYGGAIFLPCRYKVGKDYAVQPGRGQKAVARIRILSVERGPLKPLRLTVAALVDEGRREGFCDWFGLCDYWRSLYGTYDPAQLVDRIEFQRAADQGEGDR